MEHLKVKSNKGDLNVSWHNKDKLAWYATQQGGCYFADLKDTNWNSPGRFIPIHDANFHNWHQEQWRLREEMSVFDIPDGAKIIDIGCGAAVIDLLLYSYIPNSIFYLIDKEGEWPNYVHPLDVIYTDDHPCYHSWDTVLDAITTSKFDSNRFNFLSPDNNFPEDVDLIMSSFSYCFHYSKDQYWEKILSSLKKGGNLCLDVRLLPDRNLIEEISEDLKSKPTMIKIPTLSNYLDSLPNVELDTVAYRCLWKKKT